METSINKFSDYLLYSNKNIEKTVKSIVNESDNTVLLTMFEDKCVLLDHKKGEFYLADYTFDGKQVVFENFEEIEFTQQDGDFKQAVYDFFEEEGSGAAQAMCEAYEERESTANEFLQGIVAEALASKNMSEVIDYSELQGINEEVDISNENFVKAYKDRIKAKPMSSVKTFGFDKPVVVSLTESENQIVGIKNVKAKALDLVKTVEMKNKIKEAALAMYEGSVDKMQAIFEENQELLVLDEAELKEAIGKSILTSPELLSERAKVFEATKEIIEESEFLTSRKEMLIEACQKTTGCEPSTETDESDESDNEPAPEVSDAEVDKLVGALDKALDKITDEKLVKKIEDLKKALEDGKDEGQDVATVKECVEILSM